MVQRVGRGIALLFHDHGTRRGWVVSSKPRPYFTPRERPDTHCTGGWVGPRAGLDRCGKSHPTGTRSPGRPARSHSLYRLSYPAHYNTLEKNEKQRRRKRKWKKGWYKPINNGIRERIEKWSKEWKRNMCHEYFWTLFWNVVCDGVWILSSWLAFSCNVKRDTDATDHH